MTKAGIEAALRNHHAIGYVSDDGTLHVKDEWTKDGAYLYKWITIPATRQGLYEWLGY